MKEEIQKLKLMTMKPPIFAEDTLVRLESRLMFDKNLKSFEREMVERQVASLKHQIAVDLLPNLLF
jgi:hypothetical protein